MLFSPDRDQCISFIGSVIACELIQTKSWSRRRVAKSSVINGEHLQTSHDITIVEQLKVCQCISGLIEFVLPNNPRRQGLGKGRLYKTEIFKWWCWHYFKKVLALNRNGMTRTCGCSSYGLRCHEGTRHRHIREKKTFSRFYSSWRKIFHWC